MKKTRGRPRVGAPISITFTAEQLAFLESLVPPGGTRARVLRDIVQALMDKRPRRKAG